MAEQQNNYIDFGAFFKTLWQRRKVFYWVLPITFVLSCAFILCVPRYYKVEVVLAPEAQSSTPSSSLMALASTFGFDIGSMTSRDAIYPLIYPDVISSPNFIIRLFDIPITTADGEYSDTYYNYLVEKTKLPFWKRWKAKIKKMFSSDDSSVVVVNPAAQDDRRSVFWLTKKEKGVVTMLSENISCVVDKQTEVVTISLIDQDPLVCATMADSICGMLQSFMTTYRTQKARVDIEYYSKVMNEAYREYLDISEKYIQYVDGHKGIQLEKYRIELQNLESEMQIKYSAYTTFQKQYMTSQARLQENTPVFTVINSASIPLRPYGPKRTIFVLVMLFLATIVTSMILGKDQLKSLLFS